MGGFLTNYLRWHYTITFADILHVANNFLEVTEQNCHPSYSGCLDPMSPTTTTTVPVAQAMAPPEAV